MKDESSSCSRTSTCAACWRSTTNNCAPPRKTTSPTRSSSRACSARSGRPAGRRARLAHQARQPARALDAGDVSLQTPARRQPQQIRAFAELEFVAKAENIVFIGPTGVGKTGLASGLLLKALQNGYRGLFIRAQDLFDEMYASLADRSTRSS